MKMLQHQIGRRWWWGWVAVVVGRLSGVDGGQTRIFLAEIRRTPVRLGVEGNSES
jgi:hypothetical protein